jgi:membrane protein YdbS with pleckstrin-like domain
MAASAPPKRMPHLLRATYLADQESLIEETRGSKLLFFPGPVAFTVIFLVLAILAWSPIVHYPGWATFTNAIKSLASAVHVPLHTVRLALAAVFALLILVGFLWMTVRYVRWIRTVYAVTSRRVIVQKGILGRNFEEIPVTQVRGVDVRQSFGQRILGYGTVRVSSEAGASVGNEDWEGIPEPFKFQKSIENATDAIQAPRA